MSEVIASRTFSLAYIILDIVFLLIFATILIVKKKYMTVLVGIFFGVIYMVVDYGIFHLLCNSRTISDGYSMFWVLLWMSMSYGFTNFVWIWLWISKDEHLVEWSILILLWWFVAPIIANAIDTTHIIHIARTTGEYHYVMAIILFIGYLLAIIYNVLMNDRKKSIPLLWILSIGVLVQFGWEFLLLLGGIRSENFSFSDSLKTLITNSLLETNLGMPYIYLIYITYNRFFTENLKKRGNRLTFNESIEENNYKSIKYKNYEEK